MKVSRFACSLPPLLCAENMSTRCPIRIGWKHGPDLLQVRAPRPLPGQGQSAKLMITARDHTQNTTQTWNQYKKLAQTCQTGFAKKCRDATKLVFIGPLRLYAPPFSLTISRANPHIFSNPRIQAHPKERWRSRKSIVGFTLACLHVARLRPKWSGTCE